MSDTEIIEWERWPNLRIRHHPQLDWHVMTYEPEKIREMADAAERGDWNPWTKSTVDVLRALAASDDAIKALNDHQPTIPREVMGLNRAVHYLVRFAIAGAGTEAETRREVGMIWGKAAATIKEDLVLYGDVARRIINELRSVPGANGDALDRDMIYRANHMRREN